MANHNTNENKELEKLSSFWLSRTVPCLLPEALTLTTIRNASYEALRAKQQMLGAERHLRWRLSSEVCLATTSSAP